MPLLRRRLLPALLLAVGLLLSSAGGAPPPCLDTPFMAVAKRHAKLSLWIYNSLDAAKDRIKAGARWKNLDFPVGEAHADIQASLARAEHAASAGGDPSPPPVRITARFKAASVQRALWTKGAQGEDHSGLNVMIHLHSRLHTVGYAHTFEESSG